MGSSSVLRLAVLGLIVLGLSALLGTTILLFQERPVPDGVIAIGAATVGALSTLLVSHKGSDQPGDE